MLTITRPINHHISISIIALPLYLGAAQVRPNPSPELRATFTGRNWTGRRIRRTTMMVMRWMKVSLTGTGRMTNNTRRAKISIVVMRGYSAESLALRMTPPSSPRRIGLGGETGSPPSGEDERLRQAGH